MVIPTTHCLRCGCVSDCDCDCDSSLVALNHHSCHHTIQNRHHHQSSSSSSSSLSTFDSSSTISGNSDHRSIDCTDSSNGCTNPTSSTVTTTTTTTTAEEEEEETRTSSIDCCTTVQCDRQIRERYKLGGYVWDSVLPKYKHNNSNDEDEDEDEDDNTSTTMNTTMNPSFVHGRWTKNNVLQALSSCKKQLHRLPMELEFWRDVPVTIAFDKDILIARLKYWHIHGPIVFHKMNMLLLKDDYRQTCCELEKDCSSSNNTHRNKKQQSMVESYTSSFSSEFVIPLEYITDIEIMVHVIQQQPWILLPANVTKFLAWSHGGIDASTSKSSTTACTSNIETSSFWRKKLIDRTNPIWNNMNFFHAFLRSIKRMDGSAYHSVASKFSTEIRTNPLCMIQLLQAIPTINIPAIVPNKLLCTKEFAIQVAHKIQSKTSTCLLQYFDSVCIRDDYDIVQIFVTRNGENYAYASSRLRQASTELARSACIQNPKVVLYIVPKSIQSGLLQDPTFVRDVLTSVLHEQLKKNVEDCCYNLDTAVDNGNINKHVYNGTTTKVTNSNNTNNSHSIDNNKFHGKLWSRIVSSNSKSSSSICTSLDIFATAFASTSLTIVPDKLQYSKTFWKRVLKQNPFLRSNLPNEFMFDEELFVYTLNSFKELIQKPPPTTAACTTNSRYRNYRGLYFHLTSIIQQNISNKLLESTTVWRILLEIAQLASTASSSNRNNNIRRTLAIDDIEPSSCWYETTTMETKKSPLLYWLSKAPASIWNNKDLVVDLCRHKIEAYTLLDSTSQYISDSDVIRAILVEQKYHTVRELMTAMGLFRPAILLSYIDVLICLLNELPNEGPTKKLDDSSCLLSEPFTKVLSALLENYDFRLAWCAKGVHFPNEALKRYKTDSALFVAIAQRDIDGIWFRWCCKKTLRSNRTFMEQAVRVNGNLLRLAGTVELRNDIELLVLALNSPTSEYYLRTGLDPDCSRHCQTVAKLTSYIRSVLDTNQVFCDIFLRSVMTETMTSTMARDTKHDVGKVDGKNCDNNNDSDKHCYLPMFNMGGTGGGDVINVIAGYIGIPTSERLKLLQVASKNLQLWGWKY